jgi:hypothetical protein
MNGVASNGWRGIQIDCIADAVAHVWRNPPLPLKGEVVGELDLCAHKETVDKGKVVYPFRPAAQSVCRVLCSLK